MVVSEDMQDSMYDQSQQFFAWRDLEPACGATRDRGADVNVTHQSIVMNQRKRHNVGGVIPSEGSSIQGTHARSRHERYRDGGGADLFPIQHCGYGAAHRGHGKRPSVASVRHLDLTPWCRRPSPP
jgi:hypothetical protein